MQNKINERQSSFQKAEKLESKLIKQEPLWYSFHNYIEVFIETQLRKEGYTKGNCWRIVLHLRWAACLRLSLQPGQDADTPPDVLVHAVYEIFM